MPELPEVETIVRSLQSIKGLEVLGASFSYKKLRAGCYEKLKGITGRCFKEIKRRAKYIVIELDGGHALLIHLGMSGKLLLKERYVPNKHDHVVLNLSGNNHLVFNDPRRFGCFVFDSYEKIVSDKLLTNMGIEPLSEEFSPEALYSLIQGKKQNIKSFLMNAHIIVGVGNIYASEALFLAGVSPARVSLSLSMEEARKLYEAIILVLNSAINSGGSTLRDYASADGAYGYFQHHFSVYGKDGNACEKCGQPIEKIIIAGRSTFFCAKCQK